MTVDIRKSIEAKSDRLNADDLMGGPITITIEDVKAGNAESPVAVYYNGCNGKPWYPCKSMRRALVAAWSDEGKSWIGKSCTIYRDPEVIYGGVKVGGVRISAFSHIDNDMTLMLTEKRGKKTRFDFKKIEPAATVDVSGRIDAVIAAVNNAKTSDALEKMVSHDRFKQVVGAARGRADEIFKAVEEKRKFFMPQNEAEPVKEPAQTDDF